VVTEKTDELKRTGKMSVQGAGGLLFTGSLENAPPGLASNRNIAKDRNTTKDRNLASDYMVRVSDL